MIAHPGTSPVYELWPSDRQDDGSLVVPYDDAIGTPVGDWLCVEVSDDPVPVWAEVVGINSGWPVVMP
jgi:hypothetical protein